MVRFETAFTALLLVIFATMVVVAFRFPADARFLPLVAGIPGTVLCAIQLVIDLRATPRPATADGQDLGQDLGPETIAAEWRNWGYFAGYIGAVMLVGFVIASPILVALYLWREAGVRLSRSLIAAGLFLAWVHIMFERVLGFFLHQGVWGGKLLALVGLA